MVEVYAAGKYKTLMPSSCFSINFILNSFFDCIKNKNTYTECLEYLIKHLLTLENFSNGDFEYKSIEFNKKEHEIFLNKQSRTIYPILNRSLASMICLSNNFGLDLKELLDKFQLELVDKPAGSNIDSDFSLKSCGNKVKFVIEPCLKSLNLYLDSRMNNIDDIGYVCVKNCL